MEPLTLGLILGGTGLLKSTLIDRPKEDFQRKQEAVTAALSPWTGLRPGKVQATDPLGAAMQGFTGGYAQGQEFANQDVQRELLKSLKDKNNKDELTGADLEELPAHYQPWNGMRSNYNAFA